LITYSKLRVALHLIIQILDPPGPPCLFLQNRLAGYVSRYGNIELARPIDVIPVVMGIDDVGYRREITSRELGIELAS